ncbi:nickel-dependent lactate racemase family protein [Halegenticoccus soli]|uniref:lactate racemase domain-containing protein n=1 Tax=Halegenticoccus soli TaxID=1985678 RepID=UPI000C6D6F48|nr:lactate racemase domain-containing protein [Halegenticoccus soli]
MKFPNEEAVEGVLDAVPFPEFADVRYEPPAPAVDDPGAAARRELDALPLDSVPEGGRVAVGLGSRGIHDIVPIAAAVVDELRGRGFEPVAVPAMGSHGGATADGQRRTLGSLGLTEERLGCPIDARMETTVLGESDLGRPVHVSTAALEADGILVLNRVKPHTNFEGSVESGVCKMAAIGLGKQRGASAVHDAALVRSYVSAITSTFEVVRRETPFLGGLGIVENFYDRTAVVRGLPAESLPDAEGDLLERAREYMATLPYEEIDVLVVDEMGKDISGTGMDTNVIGRFRVLNEDDPERPEVKRIFARGLTEATHGNGHGIGLADVTTTGAVESLDLDQMYANALTSGSLSKSSLPVALPNDRLALTAALTSFGPYDPETAGVVWIRDTSHLSSFRVSPALVAEGGEHVTVEGRSRLAFDDGAARFEPIE